MRGKRQRALSLAYSAVQIPNGFLCLHNFFSLSLPPPTTPPLSFLPLASNANTPRSGTRWLVRRITRLLLGGTTGHPHPSLASHSVIPFQRTRRSHRITRWAGAGSPEITSSFYTHRWTSWIGLKPSNKGLQSRAWAVGVTPRPRNPPTEGLKSHSSDHRSPSQQTIRAEFSSGVRGWKNHVTDSLALPAHQSNVILPFSHSPCFGSG